MISVDSKRYRLRGYGGRIPGVMLEDLKTGHITHIDVADAQRAMSAPTEAGFNRVLSAFF
jgi:hypothetical protein